MWICPIYGYRMNIIIEYKIPAAHVVKSKKFLISMEIKVMQFSVYNLSHTGPSCPDYRVGTSCIKKMRDWLQGNMYDVARIKRGYGAEILPEKCKANEQKCIVNAMVGDITRFKKKL